LGNFSNEHYSRQLQKINFVAIIYTKNHGKMGHPIQPKVFTRLKFASCIFEFIKLAYDRFARLRSAPVRSAPKRFAKEKSAFIKFAPVRSAPPRFA